MNGKPSAQIFLSYAHKDADTLAASVREHLEAEGYKVWQDTDSIRVSKGWTGEIQDALRNSQAVVALLSPQAVRRAGAPGNPDNKDSVCLDEIEYAVDACQIPVVPVMALSSEPPFRIFRLQYLDFRDWEQANRNLLFDRLSEAVATAIRTGQGPTREWGWLPEPWDFGLFLAEKRRDFTGREWLLEQIHQWLEAGEESALLVTGGAGVGKSAIVAELVHANLQGRVLGYHCCRADTPATLEPERFVRSLAGMLSTRLEGYAGMLQYTPLQQELSAQNVKADPASAFEAGILSPLGRLPIPREGHRYLLIDALDEALTHTKSINLVELIAGRLKYFPKWLKLVATTRNEISVLNRLRGLQGLAIDVEDPRNKVDIRLFIRRRLREPELSHQAANSGKSLREIEEELLKASGGNFLFVTQVLDGIRRRHLSFAAVDQLPPRLGSLYEIFFDRIYKKDGATVDFEPARRILQAIAAAQEPPTRAELAAVTGYGPEEPLTQILAPLASFVVPRDKRYKLVHKSLFDWLTGSDEKLDQPLAGPYFVSMTKGYDLWAAHLLDRYQSAAAGRPGWSAEVRKYLPTHLTGAQRWDELADVLLDWRFMEAKTRGPETTVYDLMSDYAQAAERMPAGHARLKLISLLAEALRFDAQFIATHPETLFQCCWNRGWWHDAPASASFYNTPKAGRHNARLPWNDPGDRVYRFLERWRAEKANDTPGFVWIRYLRPGPERLGSSQRGLLQTGTDGLKCVCVSPDGAHILSGDSDHFVTLWDARSGAQLARAQWDHGEGEVQALAYRPQGDWIVGALLDGAIILLEAQSLNQLQRVPSGATHLASVAVSPDGGYAVFGDRDGFLRLWMIGDRMQEIAAVKGHSGMIECVAFSPDGKWVASGDRGFGGGNLIRLWRCEGDLKPAVKYKARHWVQDVCFTADSRTVVWGDYGGSIEFRGVVEGDAWSLQEPKGRPVSALALLPDGERLLCGPGGAFGLAPIQLWNVKTRKVERTFNGHFFGIEGISLFPDGQGFVSAGDSTLRTWDLRIPPSGVDLESVEPEVDHVVFSPEGDECFTSANNSETVWVRKVADGQLLGHLDGHAGGVKAMSLSADGALVACGCGNGVVRVWRSKDRNEQYSWKAHEAETTCLAFSRDRSLLASGGQDGLLRLFDLQEGHPLDRLFEHPDEWVTMATWSDDGTLIVTATHEQVSVWDVRSGQRMSKLQTEAHASYDSMSFTLDASEVVLESYGSALAAFDSKTGNAVALTAEHQAAFERSKTRYEKQWFVTAENEEGGEEEAGQGLAVVRERLTGETVARLPLMLGGTQAHPSGSIWGNQRSSQWWLFALEKGLPSLSNLGTQVP